MFDENNIIQTDFGVKSSRSNYSTEEKKKRLESIANLDSQCDEAEKNRRKEEEARQQRREDLKRREKILEAAFDGNNDEIRAILKEVEDINDKAGLQHTGIDSYIRKYNHRMVIDSCDPDGNSPLSEAAAAGHIETIKLLVEAGALVNHRGHCNRTSLYRAAFNGNVEAVQVLLQFGADPRIEADDNLIPLQVAGDEKVKNLLTEWNVKKTDAMLVIQEQLMKVRRAEDKARRQYETKIADEHARAIERELLTKQWEINQNKAIPRFGLQLDDDWFGVSEDDDVLDASLPGEKVSIKCLEDFLIRDVDNKIGSSDMWPLVIDPSQKAATVLRFRGNSYINALSQRTMGKERIRMTILGAIRFGKGVVLDLMGCDVWSKCEDQFDEVMDGLMRCILNKSILEKRVFQLLINESDGEDFQLSKFKPMRVKNFRFYVITQMSRPPEKLLDRTFPVRIIDD